MDAGETVEAAGRDTTRLDARQLELKGRQEPMDVVLLAGHEG